MEGMKKTGTGVKIQFPIGEDNIALCTCTCCGCNTCIKGQHCPYCGTKC